MLGAWLLPGGAANEPPTITAVATAFARDVSPRLDVPTPEQRAYADRLQAALETAGIVDSRPQFFLIVDRSAAVQAVFVYWRSAEKHWHFIGASPVSTGRPGAFEYFLTPLSVFAHTSANMDFRAEGTRNALGILGYGIEGMPGQARPVWSPLPPRRDAAKAKDSGQHC